MEVNQLLWANLSSAATTALEEVEDWNKTLDSFLDSSLNLHLILLKFANKSFITVHVLIFCLYNNIHKPSKLGIGADFHCFNQGIEPKWEDPVCANGGKWTISCSRVKVDLWWLYTLLAMLGEQFDQGDEICGAVVNIRAKQEKISIWTKNGLNEAAQMSIGKQWKECLDYNDTIGFILHYRNGIIFALMQMFKLIKPY
ncbi:hypothetical protein HPP92_000325 [Vanilla planifolia]|uniref:eIF-4F 25 kDa subunit n=1 Tax=Vanilla planifolia TaxID=51239 RepID=A0A835SAH2_VANPL|nr:hypothetical protein HPP92_000325 [Vanilla planifolia]